MQIISNVALISINETLIVQIASFLIFLYVLNRIMIRPLREVISERDRSIEKIKSDIVDSEQEIRVLMGKLKARETAAKSEANARQKEIEDSGTRNAADIFESVKEEIAQIKMKTEEEVNAQISEARKLIRAESELLAVAVMEKVLGRRLN